MLKENNPFGGGLHRGAQMFVEGVPGRESQEFVQYD